MVRSLDRDGELTQVDSPVGNGRRGRGGVDTRDHALARDRTVCDIGTTSRGSAVWWNGSMDTADLLLELYGRIRPLARQAVDGLTPDQLVRSPAAGANTIGWLVWHLARVQDHHVAEILDCDQVWVDGDWAQRFGRESDPSDTGYAHTADEMASVRPDGPASLLSYYDVVENRTRSLIEGSSPSDLDRIVDRRWDPPVTLGVRLVSIADDSLQHVGQAGYVRGLFGW